MAKNCGKCVKAIRGIDFAKCSGYCDNIFHFTCCGTTRPTYELISSNSFWLCDECRATVNNRSLRELCNTDPIVQSLKQELEAVKERITTLASAVDASANYTKASLQQLEKQLTERRSAVTNIAADKSEFTSHGSNNWPAINRPVSKRRREELHISNRDITVGTNASLSTTIATVPAAEKKFWIYLSRIHPEVSVEDIQKLVVECLQLSEPPEIVRLVKKDADTKSFRFISFKAGVDPKFKANALLPSTWTTGIFFREFEDYGSKNGNGVALVAPIALTPARR